jgi:hypothetical protein
MRATLVVVLALLSACGVESPQTPEAERLKVALERHDETAPAKDVLQVPDLQYLCIVEELEKLSYFKDDIRTRFPSTVDKTATDRAGDGYIGLVFGDDKEIYFLQVSRATFIQYRDSACFSKDIMFSRGPEGSWLISGSEAEF